MCTVAKQARMSAYIAIQWQTDKVVYYMYMYMQFLLLHVHVHARVFDQ